MIQGLLLGLFIHQGLINWHALTERSSKYQQAVTTARSLSKQLLVVGRPWGSSGRREVVGIKAHGYGDVCIDFNRASCTGGNFVPGDIRNLPFQDKQFGAVFCSHVLQDKKT